MAIRTFDTRQSTDDDHIDPQAHTLPRIREGSHETCRAALKWVWRTSGAGSIGLVWYVRVVNRPTGAVRSSSPNPNLLVLEEVDQSQEGITLRVDGAETPRCAACSSSEVSNRSTYIRRLRDLPLAVGGQSRFG